MSYQYGEDGYNAYGWDEEGYDRDGYDIEGYDANGQHREWQRDQKQEIGGDDEETETKEIQCKICMTNRVQVACDPCFHLTMCIRCAKTIKNKCPLCRIPTKRLVKIYL
jgi:hypothetical protein